MTKDEKIKIAQELTGIDLLRAYDTYRDKFNPLDEEYVENYNIIRDELLNRLK